MFVIAGSTFTEPPQLFPTTSQFPINCLNQQRADSRSRGVEVNERYTLQNKRFAQHLTLMRNDRLHFFQKYLPIVFCVATLGVLDL